MSSVFHIYNDPHPQEKTVNINLHDLYPLVSVGIPTYNGASKILNAVLSVLNQGYPKTEIIISDNCSSDNTEQVCTCLSRAFPCIKYFRQPQNIGLMPNFRFVLNHAAGDFFMWMSDDDALEPGILPQYVAFLTKNPAYALVSGKIKYWMGSQPLFCEGDFNFENESRIVRLLRFYFKVVNGSIFYGLMHKRVAEQIPLRNRIGDDWHFVASVAYLGKIRNLEATGYHKRCGGISATFKQYARAVKARSFAQKYPHVQIALDAFRNILSDSPVYARHGRLVRIALACSSFFSVMFNYYLKQYPFIIGGKLKRAVGLKTSGRRLLAG